MSVLDRIAADTRTVVAERKRARPWPELRRAAEAAPPPGDFRAALQADGLGVIAEFKRRSPSRGWLAEGRDVGAVARAYAASGATCMSVLTETLHFAGRDADLRAAAEACDLPLLRKDFTLDLYQVHEARLIGASAILLIVRMIDDGFLGEALHAARELGLAALVEVHDQPELERALAARADLVGINNRNLDTFEVSLDTCLTLRSHLPEGVVAVAESGIHTRDDVAQVAAGGFDAMLIGEALVTAADPGRRLRELLGTGEPA